MDLAFDLENTASDRTDGASLPVLVHPQWPELIARLIAAREASVSYARHVRFRSAAMRGSFDEFAAACLASQAMARVSVNPNDLGNRKSGGGIPPSVAGLTRSGGRG